MEIPHTSTYLLYQLSMEIPHKTTHILCHFFLKVPRKSAYLMYHFSMEIAHKTIRLLYHFSMKLPHKSPYIIWDFSVQLSILTWYMRWWLCLSLKSQMRISTFLMFIEELNGSFVRLRWNIHHHQKTWHFCKNVVVFARRTKHVASLVEAEKILFNRRFPALPFPLHLNKRSG